MIMYLILFFFYGSVVALVLNNVTTIGFFLYTWNNGAPLAQAAWDSFMLYISIGFLAGIVLLMSILSMRALDRATFKYARRK